MLESARSAVGQAGDVASRTLVDVMAAAPEARRFYEGTIRPPGLTEPAHIALDVLGMLPVVGLVPDLVNAGWYAGEGRYVEAGLSAGSAIPGPGDALGAGVLAGGAGVRAVKRLDSTGSLLCESREVELGRGVVPGRYVGPRPGDLLTHVPYGFGSRESWESFSKQVHDQLAQAGIPDAEIYLRGSAATGIRHGTGRFVGDAGPGDLDLALASPEVFQQAKDVGIWVPSRASRTPPLGLPGLRRLGISELTKDLTDAAGIPVTWMIYRDPTVLLHRGDAILLP